MATFTPYYSTKTAENQSAVSFFLSVGDVLSKLSLRTLRIAGRNFFVALVNVYKSDRLDNNVGSRLILGVGIYTCNRVNDLDAVYNVAK